MDDYSSFLPATIASEVSLSVSHLAIRQTVARHQPWIEEQLGAPLSEAILLRIDLDLTTIALDRFCGTADYPARNAHLRRLRSKVQGMDIPPDCAPLVSLGDHDSDSAHDLRQILSLAPPLRQIGLSWGDCPVALHINDLDHPIVLLNVGYFAAPVSGQESMARMVITPKAQVQEVLRLIAFLDGPDHRSRLHTVNGSTRPVARLAWEDLVLDSSIVSLLKEDFESFWQREDWFRERNLPFRRGYLLHGPPGNGKTSAIRAMLTSRRLSGYTIRLFDPHASDEDLETLFDEAGRNRPAVVLLEDLDRAFPRAGETKSRFSLQSLLNCLDGVGTAEGIVVIATANEPSVLDPAILRRPGRFDRVVHFPNPTAELRKEYFVRMCSGFAGEDLSRAVQESDGFSFAQLRETYILAGQISFQRKEDMRVEDLVAAIRSLKGTSQIGGASGFRP